MFAGETDRKKFNITDNRRTLASDRQKHAATRRNVEIAKDSLARKNENMAEFIGVSENLAARRILLFNSENIAVGKQVSTYLVCARISDLVKLLFCIKLDNVERLFNVKLSAPIVIVNSVRYV